MAVLRNLAARRASIAQKRQGGTEVTPHEIAEMQAYEKKLEDKRVHVGWWPDSQGTLPVDVGTYWRGGMIMAQRGELERQSGGYRPKIFRFSELDAAWDKFHQYVDLTAPASDSYNRVLVTDLEQAVSKAEKFLRRQRAMSSLFDQIKQMMED